MHFFCMYVDDGGLSVIDDVLYDASGEPVLVMTDDGRTLQQRRPDICFDMTVKTIEELGHVVPDDKKEDMGLELEYLGIDCYVQLTRRLLAGWKRAEYKDEVTKLLDRERLPNGTVHAPFDALKSAMHKLQHASETYALGRQMLYYIRRALKASTTTKLRKPNSAIIDSAAELELRWWQSQLADTDHPGLPFAVRRVFPEYEDDTVYFYGDASRELDGAEASGLGLWFLIDGIFYYAYDEWTDDEVRRFSINVLEAKTRDIGLVMSVTQARRDGHQVTHAVGFTDNTAAEHTAERGRTTSDPLHELLVERNRQMQQLGIHAATKRVSSADNVLADWLSRGRISETVRVAVNCGYKPMHVLIPPGLRDTSSLPDSDMRQ